MLGIDVEGIALRIAMGLEDDEDQPDIEKRPTAASQTQNDLETMSDSAPIDQNLQENTIRLTNLLGDGSTSEFSSERKNRKMSNMTADGIIPARVFKTEQKST